jgi:hypothetical protein
MENNKVSICVQEKIKEEKSLSKNEKMTLNFKVMNLS